MPNPGRQGSLITWALLFCGCGLRLWDLDRQPLWLDEASSWSYATRPLAQAVYSESIHPPLERVALWAWVRVIPSDSEAWLRLLPALCGCLTLWAWAWLWAELTHQDKPDPRQSWIACGLVAFSPFLVAYSQELRMYAPLCLWVVLGNALLLRWLRTAQGWAGWCAVLAGVLALYTHYFAALSWLGAFVLLLGAPSDLALRTRARAALVAAGIAAVCFAPWAWYAIDHYQAVERSGPNMLGALGYVLLLHSVGPAPVAFDTILWEQGLDAIHWIEWGLVGVLLGVVALAGCAAARHLHTHRALGWALLSAWGAPLAVGFFVMQPLSGLLRPHYMIAASPFWLGLWAVGWWASRDWRRHAIRWATITLFGVGLLAYFGAPMQVCGWRLRYGKERWRDVTEIIDQKSDASAVVLLAPGFLSMPFGYYDRKHKWFGLSDETPTPDLELSNALQKAQNPPLVWLVISHRWHDDTYINALQRAGWNLVFSQDFRAHWGIRLRAFTRPNIGPSTPQAH